jgi:hypothetical protein
VAILTGHQFFPHLISAPFHHGLEIVFTAAIIMSVTGALISLLRGKQYYYAEPQAAAAEAVAAPVEAGASPQSAGPVAGGTAAPLAD